MMKPPYIFDLCESSKIDVNELRKFGFITEIELLDFKLIQKLSSDSNGLNTQVSLNETDALLNEYLVNENITSNSIARTEAILPSLSASATMNIDEALSVNETLTIPIPSDNHNFPIIEMESLNEKLVESSDKLLESDNKRLIEIFNTFDKIYDLQMGKNMSKKKFKFFAQILQIFDMQLQLMCTQCSLIYNMCKCSSKNNNRIELLAKFLIDDHTGVIKTNYKNENFSLTDRQFGIFSGISAILLSLLKIFGTLKLDSIPICYKYNHAVSFCEIVNHKPNINLNTNQIEFMKVVHDFLYYTIINKYYQFEVPNNNQTKK